MTYIDDISGLAKQDACKWQCDNPEHKDKNSLIRTTSILNAEQNYNRNNGSHICKTCLLQFAHPSRRDASTKLTKEQRTEKIEVKCDICGRAKTIQRNSYIISLNTNNGKYMCKSCSQSMSVQSAETREKIRYTTFKNNLKSKFGDERYSSLSQQDIDDMYDIYKSKVVK